MLTGFPSLLKWTNWRRWALSLSDRFELPQTGQEYDNLEGEGEAELDLPEPALWPPCLSPDRLIYSTDNWTRQVPTLWNNCSENARIMLKFPKKKFWQGGNPPFNPQKRQKSLRAFFSLGKEIKLKIQGGGEIFQVGGKNIHPCPLQNFYYFYVKLKLWAVCITKKMVICAKFNKMT